MSRLQMQNIIEIAKIYQRALRFARCTRKITIPAVYREKHTTLETASRSSQEMPNARPSPPPQHSRPVRFGHGGAVLDTLPPAREVPPCPALHARLCAAFKSWSQIFAADMAIFVWVISHAPTTTTRSTRAPTVPDSEDNNDGLISKLSKEKNTEDVDVMESYQAFAATLTGAHLVRDHNARTPGPTHPRIRPEPNPSTSPQLHPTSTPTLLKWKPGWRPRSSAHIPTPANANKLEHTNEPSPPVSNRRMHRDQFQP